MKKTNYINEFHKFGEVEQDRILRNTVRELVVWLKAKGLYKQALEQTISLKFFHVKND